MQGNQAPSKTNTKAAKPVENTLLNQLDALDKYVSRPFFLARLPAVVEYALSIPGNCFGVPLFALFVAPNLTAMYFSETPPLSTWWHLIVWSLVLAVLVLWVFVLKGNRLAIKTFYGPMLGAIAPVFGIALLSLMPDILARQVGFFQLTAWCVSVIPVALLKPSAARGRPACQEDCGTVKAAMNAKHLAILPRLFQHDSQASFPSGDAAGAMAVMYSVGRCGGGNSLAIALICVTLSATGRMYWQAHHLGDVVVGVGLALLCCWLLEQLVQTDGCRAEWWQALSAHVVLCTIVILSRLFHKTKVFSGGTIRTEENKKL
jgi:membrane-associated phospholipid phosphatase